MPMRLIDPKQEKCIEIDGTKIYYRQLNGRDQTLLGVELSEVKLRKDMDTQKATLEIVRRLDKIQPVLSRSIIRVENPEIQPEQLMELIADPADYMRIAFEIFNSCTISEGESKNSGCSSESSTLKVVGTVRAAKDGGTA